MEEFTAAVRVIDDLGVVVHETTADRLERAAHLSAQKNLGMYDALFVQLAAELDMPLLTTDVRLQPAATGSAPIELMADQPFWADRLQRLGVAPPPIPFAQLTAAGLSAAITAAISEPSYRQRARQVAGLIAADDGAANVIERVRRLAN